MAASTDKLDLLDTFARIVERGSISAAARDLGLSQASASRRLADLEALLGTKLVERTTHNLSLTGSGKNCLEHAHDLLNAWEVLRETADANENKVEGKIKVIAPIALGQLHLIGAALEFQNLYPLVEIEWILNDGPIRFAEIGCDLWLKVGPISDDTLIVRKTASAERMIAASPKLIGKAKIISPKDLVELPCAALKPFDGNNIKLFSKTGNATQISPKVSVSSNNIFVTRQAARNGIGFAVLPKWMISEDLGEGTLLDILPKYRAAKLDIYAAYSTANRQTRRVKLFLEHIEEAIQSINGLSK